MKNLNRKLSFGVALAMTSAILSCAPSVSASAAAVYGDVESYNNGTIVTKYLLQFYKNNPYIEY